MGNKPFQMEYIPTHYDCDWRRTMRPSSILLKLQECAGEQLESLGLAYEKLYREIRQNRARSQFLHALRAWCG